jgi:hypothetical protein
MNGDILNGADHGSRACQHDLAPGEVNALATQSALTVQPAERSNRNIQGIDFTALECRLQAVANPQSLTPKERLNILGQAVETLNSAIADGIKDEAESKRAVADWLKAHGLERSIRSLERDLVRFRKRGLLFDGRAEANKLKRAPVLSQADRDALVKSAVFNHGSDVDPAWAECVRERSLSQEILDRYPPPKNHRTKCPKRIRSQVAAEIARLYHYHLGPRHARLLGADIRRDWSNVPCGAMYSSDDHTLDVYYSIPDGQGWFTMIRGQFIPVIDVRSKKILDFVLIDSPNYTAFAIRSLFKKVGMRFGLPEIWHLECGLWRRSKLLGRGGPSRRGQSLPEIEQNFAERLGTKIVHALPGNAKAKVIENVFSLLVRYMAGEPGYVGNDEMHVKYERVRAGIAKVEKGPINGTHPAKLGFRSGDEWKLRLEQICTEYNNAPQESRVIGEYLSPEDAWLKYRQRDASGAIVEPVILPKELEYMLGQHQQEVTITRNGVSLFNGKYRYRSPELMGCSDKIMLASFDPDDPSQIVVQDLKGERFIGVPLVPDVPAIADSEALSLGAKEAASANRMAKARYSELKSNWLPKGRPVIVDAQAHQTARNMEKAKASGREQFRRTQTGSGSTLQDQFLYEALTATRDELSPGPASRPVKGDTVSSIRELQNFLGDES